MQKITIGFSLSALLLTGCNSGASSTPGQCNPPNGIATVLVYPAPNSTGIPDNFGVVVLGSSGVLPASFQAYIVNDTTGNPVYYNPLGTPPNPIPTPSAVPPFANPSYAASGNPGVTFVAGSTLSVYLNDANSNCVPTLLLGSFRVQ
jgi:hypothetical protein